MSNKRSILVTGIVSSVWCFSVLAQTAQPTLLEGEVPPPPKFEDVTIPIDNESGLQVEERRYENRLDGVTVEHQNTGLRDYYNFSDPDIERRDGGIVEGSAMRTWRLGGGKK